MCVYTISICVYTISTYVYTISSASEYEYHRGIYRWDVYILSGKLT